jgi:hypothetical protein
MQSRVQTRNVVCGVNALFTYQQVCKKGSEDYSSKGATLQIVKIIIIKFFSRYIPYQRIQHF